jgi:hypothetical protein
MTATMTPRILIDLVRRFLRDQPKLNALIRKNETDDDEIKLAINMSISDWNSTPPILQQVGLDNFPVLDWLIVSTAMWCLVSAGVLQYRNELQFNDSGITVNPWSKGPAYTNLAGMWANMVEKKKSDYKIAINYGRTFGIVRSPEFMMWDYSGLYTGPDYLDATGAGAMSAIPGNAESHPQAIHSPSKTVPFIFTNSTWEVNAVNNQYEINFYHNLHADCDVRITDPSSGQDLRNQCSIRFPNQNVIIISVPLAPDGRFSGQMIAFKL